MRRLGRVGLALAIVVVGFATWRATSLRGLPGLADPFDVPAYLATDLPDAENAFTWYLRATDAFLGSESDISNRSGVYAPTTGDPSRSDDAVLDREKTAVDLWFEGTKLDRARYFRPDAIRLDTSLPVVQRLRSFARLANLRACRLQQAGDLAGAWGWLRANLRCSRHVGTDGSIIERQVGVLLCEMAASQANLWADDPRVDARLLRVALDDLAAIDRLSSPFSRSIAYEYVLYDRSFADATLADELLGLGGPTSAGDRLRDRLDRAWLVVRREPERSRRALRLLFANWLAACDLPPAERSRRAVKVGALTLYRPGPEQAEAPSPEAIGEWIATSRYLRAPNGIWASLDGRIGADERARAGLIVHVAEQLYLREHGRPSPSVEALVGPCLKSIPPGFVAIPPDEPPR